MARTISLTHNNKTRNTTPYVWHNGEWHLAIPHVYHSQEWHPTYQEGVCENLLPTSVDINGNIYGYQNGKYAINHQEENNANYVTTGFIPITPPIHTIYFKGAEWAFEDQTQFIVYNKLIPDENEKYCNITGKTNSLFSDFGTFHIVDEDKKYYRLELNDNGKTNLYNKYYRLSLKGTGENLIISHNEPIPD